MAKNDQVITGVFDDARSEAVTGSEVENSSQLVAGSTPDYMRTELQIAYDMHPSRVDEYWRDVQAALAGRAERPDPTQYSEPLKANLGGGDVVVSLLDMRDVGGS